MSTSSSTAAPKAPSRWKSPARQGPNATERQRHLPGMISTLVPSIRSPSVASPNRDGPQRLTATPAMPVTVPSDMASRTSQKSDRHTAPGSVTKSDEPTEGTPRKGSPSWKEGPVSRIMYLKPVLSVGMGSKASKMTVTGRCDCGARTSICMLCPADTL